MRFSREVPLRFLSSGAHSWQTGEKTVVFGQNRSDLKAIVDLIINDLDPGEQQQLLCRHRLNPNDYEIVSY